MNMNVSKTNGVKLLAVVAVLAMVVCAFAAVMPAEETDAATNDPTYLSGAITSTQNYGNGTEVVVYDDLVIPAGMAMVISGSGKLTINAEATLTIAAGGQLIIQQTDATHIPTVIINGSIVSEGGKPTDYPANASVPSTDYIATIVNNAPAYDSVKKTGVLLAGSISLTRGAEMSGAVIDQTKLTTYKLGGTAFDDVDSGIMTQSGATITIGSRTSNISTIGEQSVYLCDGATFNLNGYANNVTVTAIGTATYYTAGSITIDSGANTTAPEGNRTVSDVTFTVTTETCSAFTAKTDGDRITLRQYILNVDGEINSPFTETESEDKTTITAYRETLAINTGVIYNGKLDSGKPAFYTVDADGKAGDAITPISAVSGTLNMSEYSVLIVNENAYLRVSGTLDVAYAEADESTTKPTSVPEFTNPTMNGVTFAANKTFQINGTVYVTGTVTGNAAGLFAYPQDAEENGYFGNLIYVDGGSITLEYNGDFVKDMKAGQFGDSHLFGALVFGLVSQILLLFVHGVGHLLGVVIGVFGH